MYINRVYQRQYSIILPMDLSSASMLVRRYLQQKSAPMKPNYIKWQTKLVLLFSNFSKNFLKKCQVFKIQNGKVQKSTVGFLW